MKKETKKTTDVTTQNKEPEVLPPKVKEKESISEMKQTKKSIYIQLEQQQSYLETIASISLNHSSLKKYLFQMATYIATTTILEPCFKTLEGQKSILHVVTEAIRLGVLPGVDAYITPRSTKINEKWAKIAHLDPTAEGYETICCAEPNAIFSQVKTGTVYINDTLIDIDKGAGTIKHIPNIIEEEGEVIGIWIKCLPTNPKNEVIVDYYSMKRLFKARESSQSYKSYQETIQLHKDCKSGKIENVTKNKDGSYYIPKFYKNGKARTIQNPDNLSKPIWDTHLIEMCIKTIKKSVLKPFARVKMGIQRGAEIIKEDKSPDSNDTPQTIGDTATNLLQENAPPNNDERFFNTLQDNE